jgi:hypothetical protein
LGLFGAIVPVPTRPPRPFPGAAAQLALFVQPIWDWIDEIVEYWDILSARIGFVLHIWLCLYRQLPFGFVCTLLLQPTTD